MRTILDHGDVVGIADCHQTGHIGDMSAHVRQHKDVCLRGFRFQIIQVDAQISPDLDQNGARADGGDGTRHRGQRPAIGQHWIARTHPQRAQGTAHRISARCHCQCMRRAGLGGEFDLQCRDLRRLRAITVQRAGAHDLDRGRDR